MRRRTVRLIAAKELLDTLRDRRTLFVSLVLPLLLYPALLLGLTQIIGATQKNLEDEAQRVLVDGLPAELVAALREKKLAPLPAKEAGGWAAALHLQADVLAAGDDGEKLVEGARAAMRRALADHDVAGAVLGGEAFPERLERGRQGEAVLLFDPTDESSKMAARKVGQALEEYAKNKREELYRRFPGEVERLRFAERPVRLERREVASASQKGAYSFAPLLGMLIVIMALTGAFYPAVDLAAGEKERGTLETVLVAPVTRREIVVGKFVAVWAIAIVTALSNLLVMGLTFSKLAGMIGSAQVRFDLPFATVGVVSLILVPTAALFSALTLAVSSFATSYKEGQHYMTPLYLVVMPLAMVSMLPNVELGYPLALVPVANVVLLVKAMLLGGEAAGPAFVATAAMVVYAALALWAAMAVFNRESVLFRTGSGRAFDAISLRASREGLPTPGLAVLAFFVVIAVMFFLAGRPETGTEALGAFLLTQFAGVLAPALLLARRARLNLARTFALRTPRPGAAPLAAVAAVGALLVVVGLHTRFMPPREAQGFEQIVGLLAEWPPWLFVALLAVVPPLCEELLCRGFILSAFRPRYGDGRAIVISAALFGLLHLDLYRFPATFAAGLALGWIRVRTGSIFPGMIFHMIYNGLIALTGFWAWWGGAVAGLDWTGIGLAALLLAASLVALQRLAGRN